MIEYDKETTDFTVKDISSLGETSAIIKLDEHMVQSLYYPFDGTEDKVFDSVKEKVASIVLDLLGGNEPPITWQRGITVERSMVKFIE